MRLAGRRPLRRETLPEQAQDFPRPSSAQRCPRANHALHAVILKEVRHEGRRERIDMLPGMEDASAVGADRFQDFQVFIVWGRCNQKAPGPENTPDVSQGLLELFGGQMFQDLDEKQDINASILDWARNGVGQGDTAKKRMVPATLTNLVAGLEGKLEALGTNTPLQEALKEKTRPTAVVKDPASAQRNITLRKCDNGISRVAAEICPFCLMAT